MKSPRTCCLGLPCEAVTLCKGRSQMAIFPIRRPRITKHTPLRKVRLYKGDMCLF